MTNSFKRFVTVMATVILLSASLSASALELRIEPSFQEAAPSDVVAMDLVAAALGGDVIGAYDIFLSYDPAALTLNSFQVSDALGNIAMVEAIDISFGETAPGTINLAVLSFLTAPDLEVIQGVGPVLLATLDFNVDVLAAGTSTFVYIDSINSLVANGEFPAMSIPITSTRAGRVQHADPDVIADAVTTIPVGFFANSGDPEGQRNAVLSRLSDIEQDITDGDIAGAIRALQNLQRHVDGCPPSADRNDWITNCPAQIEIWGLIEALIITLMSL